MRSPCSSSFLAAALLGGAACGEAPPPPAAAPEAPIAAPAKTATDPSAVAARAPPAPPPLPAVELTQVAAAAPPPKMPKIEILAPARNQLVPTAKAGAFALKLRVKDWELAPGGDHVCVVLDRGPCKPMTDATKPPMLGELGVPVAEGAHVVFAFARRASLESVKPAGKTAAFAAVPFFVGKRGPPVYKEGAPLVFVSVAELAPAPPEGVLIDFLVVNAEVGEKKSVVNASVGGPGLGPGVGVSVSSLAPFRLKNAQPGEHLLQFSLQKYEPNLEASGSATTVSYGAKPVPGPFATMTRSFTVAAR